MTHALRALLAVALCVPLSACPSRSRGGGALGGDQGDGATASKTTLEIPVAVSNDKTATLGAALYRPEPQRGDAPAVLFVPGGGRVSRDGVRPGDGVSTYEEPVAVTAAWAQAVAVRGMLALAWDKRTCTPTDHPDCRKNPTPDLDAEGPVALAKDVDAACAVIVEQDGFDGRIVLWAHGQAVAVALASECAKRAEALVLVAPIPRRIDEVMVDTLTYLEGLKRKRGQKKAHTDEGKQLLGEANDLRNAAASLQAMFESMDNNQFAQGARVKGATVPFWKAWIELTDGAAEQVKSATAPRVVVQGQWDLQFTPADRNAVAAWGEEDGITYLKVDKADHHLLRDGVLEDDTVALVTDALVRALAGDEPEG